MYLYQSGAPQGGHKTDSPRGTECCLGESLRRGVLRAFWGLKTENGAFSRKRYFTSDRSLSQKRSSSATGSRFTCITASSALSKCRRSNIPSCEGNKRVFKYVQKTNYGLGRTGLGHDNKRYCTSQSARDARNPQKATAPHLVAV